MKYIICIMICADVKPNFTTGDFIGWTSVILAIFLTVLGIIALFSFKTIKENEKRINDRISKIDEKEQEFKDYISRTEAINKRLSLQIENANEYLYEAIKDITNQIRDGMKDKIISETLNKRFEKTEHSYQITNLYSEDNENKLTALTYLQQNGTPDDIEHLEYVSKYDLVEVHKEYAREIIGIIRYKEQHEN